LYPAACTNRLLVLPFFCLNDTMAGYCFFLSSLSKLILYLVTFCSFPRLPVRAEFSPHSLMLPFLFVDFSSQDSSFLWHFFFALFPPGYLLFPLFLLLVLLSSFHSWNPNLFRVLLLHPQVRALLQDKSGAGFRRALHSFSSPRDGQAPLICHLFCRLNVTFLQR